MNQIDHRTHDKHGCRFFEYGEDGPCLRRVQEAVDLIAEARGVGASVVVVPINKLDPAFFELRTGFAGEVLQKFVNYGLRVVILGDATDRASGSSALRDFIRESNRGSSVWFVATRAELDKRLEDVG